MPGGLEGAGAGEAAEPGAGTPEFFYEAGATEYVRGVLVGVSRSF